MRRTVITILLLVVVVGHAQTNQPRIACAAPSYNFGRIGNTSPVAHTFQLVNVGTAPLAISSVETGCGCTAAKAGTNAIAPGGGTEIMVRFDTAHRTGEQHKAIYVQSNDRTNPLFRLEITGELFDVAAFDRPPMPVSPVSVVVRQSTVTATPSTLFFGRVRPHDRPEGQVSVGGEGTNDFTVANVSCTDTNLELKTEALDARRWRITVRLLRHQVGQGGAELRIVTTHPAMRDLKVPVMWDGVGDIYSTPAEIPLMVIAGQTNAVCRYVAFRSHSGKAFKVERVEVPVGNMIVTLDSASSNTWRCEIQGLIPSTNLHGRSIVFFTDRADEERLQVPLRVAR